MRPIRLVMMIAAALVALGTAGCGEREQSALYKDGKYRGKTDTRPWDNAPAATSTGSWSKGDQASWENQLRSRHVTAQNENHRIGH